MIQTRTSWNSSSEELGLSVHGATVPPTLPEALTWGNKSPTASAPALFLPLPPTPKGPTLKKAGWGWGPQLISVGSEKRGAILNSLTFLFQFLSFVKVWALGFSRFVLYVKGHDLGFKGIASLPPTLVCPVWCPPQGICQLHHQLNSHILPGAVPGLCWSCEATSEKETEGAVAGAAWPAFLHPWTVLFKEHRAPVHQPCCGFLTLTPPPTTTLRHSDFSFPV